MPVLELKRSAAGLKPAVPAELQDYRPRFPFAFELAGYRVATAADAAEVAEALTLRHDVFYGERLGRRLDSGLDFDAYDLIADHVLVRDLLNGKIVATYRLLCSKFVDGFYSEGEFTLERFLASSGVKLELGRACTAPTHRDGAALALVWKGLARYARGVNADILFGCASVDSTDLRTAIGLLAFLRKENHSDLYGICPKDPYRFDWSGRTIRISTPEAYRKDMPPLLRAYLNAGAKVHGFPGLDRDLLTTDFFTALDLRAMNPRFAKRFFTAS